MQLSQMRINMTDLTSY